jgi:hypothetical protein
MRFQDSQTETKHELQTDGRKKGFDQVIRETSIVVKISLVSVSELSSSVVAHLPLRSRFLVNGRS